MRVLVVEDDFDSAMCLGAMVRIWGHEGLVAESAREALAIASGFDPEVAILDYHLPDFDGAELASRLREDALRRNTMLIAFTGNGSDEVRERTLAAGVSHVLVKPVDFVQLEGILKDKATNG